MNVVAGDVATCTGNNFFGRDVAIDGCQTLVCSGDTASWGSAKITNTTNVNCTGYQSCRYTRMANVKNIKCSSRFACIGASIEVDKNAIVDCQGGTVDFPACYGDLLVQSVAMSVKGENGCSGPNITFTDASNGGKMNVSNKVVKKYGQACTPKKCKGILSCFWSWVLSLFF